jgi:hypothetical protein
MGWGARSVLVGLTAVGVLGLATPAAADFPLPPRSYQQVAPGGRFVFVMIAPVPVDEDNPEFVVRPRPAAGNTD